MKRILLAAFALLLLLVGLAHFWWRGSFGYICLPDGCGCASCTGVREYRSGSL